MIAAGEDPRFIVRRLIISASEDVGNADPRALQVAVAAAQALDWVGLPEAQYALAQATILHRDGAQVGLGRVARTWRPMARRRCATARCPCRNHLRSAGDRRMKHHGIGVGYRYPHDFEGADVEQQYLPDELVEPTLLRPDRPGLRGDDRRAHGGPRRARREKPRRKDRPDPPMASMGDGVKGSMESRKKLAETQNRDAGS